MADCKKCRNVDVTLFEALETVVWYNGMYYWLKELRDSMVKHLERTPEIRLNYASPIKLDDIGKPNHFIWTLLVAMFGNWGTSVNSGWIENVVGCVEFIDALCENCWRWDDER